MAMITATAWVPRGYAAQRPVRQEFDEEEFDRIAKLTKSQINDAKHDLEEVRAGASNLSLDDGMNGAPVSTTNGTAYNHVDDDDLKEYDLQHYDDSPASDNDSDEDDTHASIFGNIKSLAYHHNNDSDPYITLRQDPNSGADLADDDSDREDLEILPTDNLVLAASVEDEVAHLQVYVYEDNADNLYVHHDLMLPAIPLCVEWLDMPVRKPNTNADSRGNFVAVGTMDPDIELWDLDTVDCMYPNAILGQGGYNDASSKPATGKKKRKKSKRSRDEYHVDAVLSLAANRQHRNLLASASADTTVKLWDLNTQKCAKSYTYHTGKVCSLAWHPSQATAMLSGSYDRTVVAGDMRAPEQGTRRWKVDSDIEVVKWDPHDDNYFYVSSEAGLLLYFDARKTSSVASPAAPEWRLQAHEKALTTFSLSSFVPGFLATGSDDKTVKLWNTSAAASGDKGKSGPSVVTSRELDVGRVFSVDFAPDAEVGYRLAVAGSKGSLRVWDTSTNKAVRAAFAGKKMAVKRNGVDGGRETNGDGGVAVFGADEDVKERLVSIGEGGADSDTESSNGGDEDEDNAGSDDQMEDDV